MNLDELDDLARRSAATVNAIAARSAADIAVDGGVAVTSRHDNRRRVWIALGAAAALIAAVTGWVVSRDDDDQLRSVNVPPTVSASTSVPRSTTPTTAAALAPGSWDWLTTAFGVARAEQEVPIGWEVREVSGLRFATPAGWRAPAGSCETGGAPGAVFADQATEEKDCARVDDIEAVTIWEALLEVPNDPASTYGQIELEHLQLETCPNCSGYLRGPTFTVRVTGEHWPQLVATFAEPGWLQAVRNGTVAERIGWQDVSVAGLEMSVPASWPVYDLSEGARPDPGTCSSGLFTDGPAVALGFSSLMVECEFLTEYDLRVSDGVWVRADADPDRQGDEPLARGEVAGLEVAVLRGDSEVRSGAIEVAVRGGDEPLRITIGVGADVSIARSVLRSIRPAGTDPAPTAVSGPTPTTDDRRPSTTEANVEPALQLRGDGLGEFPFGAPMQDVLDALEVRMAPEVVITGPPQGTAVHSGYGCAMAADTAALFDGVVVGFSDQGAGPEFSSWAAFSGTGDQLSTAGGITPRSVLDELRRQPGWEPLDPETGTPAGGIGRFEATGWIYAIRTGDGQTALIVLSAGPDCDVLHPAFLEAGPEPIGLHYRVREPREDASDLAFVVRTDRDIATEYVAWDLVGDIQRVTVALDGDTMLWTTRVIEVDGAEPAREVLDVYHPPNTTILSVLPAHCGVGYLATAADGTSDMVTADAATRRFVITSGSCA